MSIQSLSDTVTAKQLFLIDAIGAVLSASLLGIAFILLENIFGTLPKTTIHYLILIPCVFALYSFTCFLRFPTNWSSYMKIIAVGNLLYCFITAGLLMFLHTQLTTLGILYFLIEIIIIVALVIVELRKANTGI